jgi:uncharacterized protein (TIGR02391 family)
MLTARGVVRLSELAGIQYLGAGGDSLACVRAMRRVLAWPERPRTVRLLTSDQVHAFLLTFEREPPIAIKEGFTSGYRGAGPSALAEALLLLSAFSADVEEIEVRREVLERLSAAALTQADLNLIESAEPVRPTRWYDYVYARYQGRHSEASVWGGFEPGLPFVLIDPRIADLALDFHIAHDRVLLDGFRRLEDRIRERTGLVDHGTKLFSQAFAGDESRLTWHGPAKGRGSKPDFIDKGEQAGRAQIFIGTYQAFRNPRAHRTSVADAAETLSEFLLLNQLFRFEAEAIERPTSLDCEPPQP